MIGAVALGCVWLAFALPLIFAAIGRNRGGTKIGALLGLAIMFVASWMIVVAALGEVSAHSNYAAWPSPALLAGAFVLAHVVVTITAFRRKFG